MGQRKEEDKNPQKYESVLEMVDLGIIQSRQGKEVQELQHLIKELTDEDVTDWNMETVPMRMFNTDDLFKLATQNLVRVAPSKDYSNVNIYTAQRVELGI